jgi:soluble lytic murein transglycosylase-like protein
VIRRAARTSWLALAAVAAAGQTAASGPILYYVKDGAIVFTDTPSRRDARPVPGLQEIRVALPDSLPTTPYDPFIRNVASQEGLDPSLIKAVALVESGFNPRAVSPKGARGLMQLMPATARLYGVRDPHDPYENLRAGTRHLRDLLIEFHGDLPLALAAYNAGSGAVRRSGGIPNYKETRDYVRKVTSKLGQTPRRAAAPPSGPDEIVLERNADGSIKASN